MKQKKRHGPQKFIGILYLGFSLVLIYMLVVNASRVINENSAINKLESRKTELVKEKEYLIQQVKLLEDDDYVARYAREHYIFSKDGEAVVQLPDVKE